MKALILIATILFSGASFSQVHRFNKYEIGSTGCTVYLPDEIVFNFSYSDDSSEVYTGELFTDSASYGIICVRFREPIGEIKEPNVELLISYLDYLKQALGIVEAAGYGKGHTMENHPTAAGVIDYWQDAANTEYRVKAWVENRFLAVLYVTGTGSSSPIHDVFLNGFHFPAE